MAAVAELLARVRAELGARQLTSGALMSGAGLAEQVALEGARGDRGLALDWPGLDELLPGGALPGGVVELASVGARSSTAFAVRAVRAAHARDAGAWCAWLDPESTLYAPGLLVGGVDLTRLLVVRPPRAELGRVAVKLVTSGAFDVVAVDMDAVGRDAVERDDARGSSDSSRTRRREFPPEVLVRKLALASEDGKTHVLLLTAAEKAQARTTSWPVGMRLDVARIPTGFTVTVGKTRSPHGRIGAEVTVPLLAHQVAAPALAKTGAKTSATTGSKVTYLHQRFAG